MAKEKLWLTGIECPFCNHVFKEEMCSYKIKVISYYPSCDSYNVNFHCNCDSCGNSFELELLEDIP